MKMTLKEVKELQEMGFSLEEIKKEYFTEAVSGNDEKPAETEESKGTGDQATGTEGTEEVKKNTGSGGSADPLAALKNEITEIKTMIFNKYSSENKESNKAKTDDLLSAMNSIINKEGK